MLRMHLLRVRAVSDSQPDGTVAAGNTSFAASDFVTGYSITSIGAVSQTRRSRNRGRPGSLIRLPHASLKNAAPTSVSIHTPSEH